ncbi:MAG TPA: serine/threonine-protein kinase, partial [Planctomycetaceae bacterium]|nr:serine/threonine-protein kinase [Planctomycetaceae bacterium]
MPEQSSYLKEVFASALAFDTAEARTAYLGSACGDDDTLRAEVDSLLEAHSTAEGFLNRAVRTIELPRPFASTRQYEPTGTQIGPYTIREQLGEGGMGVVYLAEQSVPVRREVALKIIKPGMDSKEVIARFEAERQTLAMMSHPHIAKVLDGGTTESGRPYFVMELVKGIPITEYCDRHRLDLRQRLELFVTVCRAVQHAHLKGIIHRDLKPSNVLVELQDDGPVPRVIDFGIAKATDPQLSQQAVHTRFAQLVGTPLYMSPEQVEIPSLDVDTRSDVYSLGVVLYELLTGTTPFDESKLSSVGTIELRRIICEKEPLRPSQKVSSLTRELSATISSRRQTDPRQLSLSMRRELDWIVLQAMEKDRTRRYESASTLARDIQRYLNNESVNACPPSVAYRLQKFAGRHKGLLTTVSLVLLTAITGTVVSLIYATKAFEAADDANLAQSSAEQHARDAREARDLFETLLYTADMKLVSDAIANQDVSRAEELLQRNSGESSGNHPRGFEYYFYQKQVVQPRQTVIQQFGWVEDVELSPDGRWLAITSEAGTVTLYQTANWERYRHWTPPSESVNGLAWSPDGTSLAAACSDGSLRVWNVAANELLITIPAHEGQANDVAFSRDGLRLCSGGDEGLAKLWDVESGEPLINYSGGHQRELERLSFSPDGRFLATASSDSSLCLWKSDSGELLHRIAPGGGRMVCVTFSPDGKLIAGGNIDGDLCLIETETGRHTRLARQLDGIEALAFCFDGRWLATADRGGAIQLHPVPDSVNGSSTSVIGRPPRWVAHQGRVLSLTGTADGRGLISGGRDGAVHIWHPDLEATRWELDPASGYSDIATGLENRLYVTGREISVWDLKTRKLIETFAPADPPWLNAACSADGRFLAAVGLGRLSLFDLGTREVVRTWPLENRLKPHRLAISSDGSAVAFAEYTDREFVTIYYREG